jgi:hypothetical protein
MVASGKTLVHSPKLIGGDEQAAPFVVGSDQLEQYRGFRLVAPDVAEVIENDEVVLVKLLDGALQGVGA